MRIQFLALSAAAVLAASANAAEFDGVSAKITGGYDYSGTKSVSSNGFNFGGAANYAIPNTQLNVQGLVDYSENKTLHLPADTWTSGGAITWRDPMFAFGVAGDYKTSRLAGFDFNYGSYGLIGEYYPTSNITLRLNGGGISGDFGIGHSDGGYYGGGASYYVDPNTSLNASGSYATVGNLHWTHFEAGAEYLPPVSLPVSLSAAYTHDNTNAAGYSAYGDGVMVRLSWHLGDGNSLVDYDRSGPLAINAPKLPFNVLTAAGYTLVTK